MKRCIRRSWDFFIHDQIPMSLFLIKPKVTAESPDVTFHVLSFILLRPLSSLTDHRQEPGAGRHSAQRHTSVRCRGWEEGAPAMQALLHRKWVWGGEELAHIAGGGSRQRASDQQLEKLRLSYWHAGPSTHFCPETAVNQSPIATQSGACSCRRMLMCCNLPLPAFCSQQFHLPYVTVTILASTSDIR